MKHWQKMFRLSNIATAIFVALIALVAIQMQDLAMFVLASVVVGIMIINANIIKSES